jgi:hypothetical protein
MKRVPGRFWTTFVTVFALGTAAQAAIVFVRNDPNSVGIVDQHPLARGDALYDTQPAATGRYDRRVDVDPMFDPTRRYDALADYYNESSAAKLRTSMINGGWYCTPTAALSLVKYWDADPRFPELFDAARGDTDRSVILEIARLMDTDDLIVRGGNDPNENHQGTSFEDILPSLLSYFNMRYPGKFGGGERILPENADTDDYNGAWGAAYDTAIRRNIPVLLEFRAHTTVGIGFNTEFARETASHYRVNDPWDARRNIAGSAVGRGRPLQVRGVYGASWAEELYGPGTDIYDETENGLSPSGLPEAFHYVFAIEDGDPLPSEQVPQPSTILIFVLAAAHWPWLKRMAHRGKSVPGKRVPLPVQTVSETAGRGCIAGRGICRSFLFAVRR